MTEQGQPTPQRIGDTERDRAAALLREHMAQGRLTPEEFDERVDAALRARTAGDLEPLFTDLPGPRPGEVVATTGTPPSSPTTTRPEPAARTSGGSGALAVLTAVMWPVTILLISAIGWGDFWWLVFVPVVISSVLGKNRHDHREEERRRIEREQQRLDRRRRALDD